MVWVGEKYCLAVTITKYIYTVSVILLIELYIQ